MDTKPAKLVRYRSEIGCKAAIAVSGRTRLHLVVIADSGVTELDVPLIEERYTSDLPGNVNHAARKMLAAGRRLGITKAARTLLRDVLK